MQPHLLLSTKTGGGYFYHKEVNYSSFVEEHKVNEIKN